MHNETSRCERGLSKLSYSHVPGKEPLLPWTVGEVMDRTTDAIGDNTAIVSCHQNITKTFSEYKKDVDDLAASLVSLKLPIGSKIAVLGPNLYEGALLLFAAPKAGLVMVGMNPHCTVPELQSALNKTESAALIVALNFTIQDYYQMLLQIAPELEGSAPGELRSSSLPFLKNVITIGDTRKPGAVTLEDLVNTVTSEDHAAMRVLSTKVQFDQDAYIQFSSGTTGQPKAARLTHFNVVNNANLCGRVVGFHQQPESICLNAQLIFGLGRTVGVLAAMMFGCTVVLPSPFFSEKAALEAITRHRCTIVYGTPTNYTLMLSELGQGEYDVSSVKKGVIGGQLCSPELLENAKTRLNAKNLYIVYGATETSPVFTSTNPEEPTESWIGTVGTPLDHVEVKVVDAEGRIVPVNTSGELCTRGPHVFKGYLGDEEKTKEAIQNNWYHTGDEGTMSEDGRITFLGRIKEMINFAGWNVHPREIEEVLNTHPDVEEAQVIGVPDKVNGEMICAWIKLRPDKELSPEDIKTFCDGKLHEYKVPEYILFVDSFPRTLTGKVQKKKMREESTRLLNL